MRGARTDSGTYHSAPKTFALLPTPPPFFFSRQGHAAKLLPMRLFLLLAAATLAASPASGQAPVKEPARPLRDLNVYVDDYPASAMRAGEQGIVHFRLDISAEGRVTRCEVTQSSGSAMLDATTCRTLRARARFTPARDANGNAVPDSLTSSIRWSLSDAPASGGATAEPVPMRPLPEHPGGPPSARANLASYVSNDDYPLDAIRNGEQGTVRFTLTVGADGRVSNCMIVESSGSASLDSTSCRILTSAPASPPPPTATAIPPRTPSPAPSAGCCPTTARIPRWKRPRRSTHGCCA